MLGLLAELPRKNCWSIAEDAGDRSPGGMQHLLGRARWDADGVRDDVRDYLTERLGDRTAILVVTGRMRPARRPAGYPQHGRLAAVVTRMSMRAGTPFRRRCGRGPG